MEFQSMWPVVPLCKAQLEDVNPLDVLNGGLYRRCNTYKGGGGYDKFPEIWERRFGKSGMELNNQFVVQVQGCPLHCPYCYVTEAGVRGQHKCVSSLELIKDFRESGCGVFHLMGGAPALYLNKWPDLLRCLDGDVFHSDFLGLEGEYDIGVLREIAQYKNALYAISIKGYTSEEFEKNTATKFNSELFKRNMEKLLESGVSVYFTFTGMTTESIQQFKDEHKDWPFEDSFGINLVHYKALDWKG